MANDELYTPKYIFDALGVIFELDVCAPIGGPLHTPAIDYYDIDSDGLKADWYGKVWMNPPFSGPKEWVNKWLDHQNGICLLPMGGNGNWLGKMWDSEAACLVMPPNVPFINTQGEIKKISYRISLWAIGETNITALKMSNLGRIR
jgi:hypothetical protein